MDYRGVMPNRHKVPKMDYWELGQRAHKGLSGLMGMARKIAIEATNRNQESSKGLTSIGLSLAAGRPLPPVNFQTSIDTGN